MSVNWDSLVIGPVCDIFGGAVTYTPVGGLPFSVDNAVFDKAILKEAIFQDGTVGVTTTKPTMGVQLSKFPSIPIQNDRVFVGIYEGMAINTTFAVKEVREDGHGWAFLLLNKVSSP